MGYKLFGIKNHSGLKRQKPTRNQLFGLSCSEFKTLLKRRGYKISRDFFKNGSIAQYKGRMYRFRWWGDEFFVDISCPLGEFDRWANSTDDVINFFNWIEE